MNNTVHNGGSGAVHGGGPAQHFHYSPHSRLTLPIVSLVAIIAACCASWAWLRGVDARVEKNTRDIEELRRGFDVVRETLIRIDERGYRVEENVRLLREELAELRKGGR